METRTVFMYGRSMLLTLVAGSLAQNPELHVIHGETWGEIERQTNEFSPDVLIYDLDSASESAILPLLFKNPRLQLIGLDVETNRAVLIIGKETRSLTLERVEDIIIST
jgi:hypothetical protein